MSIEELYEHAQTFMQLQECVPTDVENLRFYPEASADEVHF